MKPRLKLHSVRQPPLYDTVTFNLSHTNIKLWKEWAETSQCGKKWNIKCDKKQSEAKREWGKIKTEDERWDRAIHQHALESSFSC